MKTLADIIALYDAHNVKVLDEKNIASKEEVDNAETMLNIKFGTQLRELLLSKLYRLSSNEIVTCKFPNAWNNIVKYNEEQWEDYPFAKGYIFFLSQDEWDMLVDSDDNVYLVEISGDRIEPQHQKLFDWFYEKAEGWLS